MSKVSTLSQGAGILTLIDEQKLDLEQVQKIRPYLVALAKGIKSGGLPDIETFRAFAEGRAKVEVLKYLIDFDRLPSIAEDWEILPDSEQLPNRMKGMMEFDPEKIALHLDEDQKRGKVIKGYMLRKKLENVPVYGTQLLDFYLANTHLIPEEWKGKTVFFWGTIYRRSDGRLYVCYLFWNGSLWDWDYCRTSFGWDALSPAARWTT